MSFASTHDQYTQKNQCTYDDFSTPVRVRQDRIIVDGKTLFVNLGYLAEYSTFFANSFEQDEERIYIDDHTYEEMIELMRCLFFCPQRKRVTSENIDVLVKLAHDFDIERLQKRCDEVIKGKVDSFSTNRIIDLIYCSYGQTC